MSFVAEDLYSDGELSGLSVLEGSEQLAKEGKAEIEKQAKEMLQSGAVSHNQTTVANIKLKVMNKTTSEIIRDIF